MMGRANRLTGSSAVLLMALMLLAGCRSAAPTLDATDLEAFQVFVASPESTTAKAEDGVIEASLRMLAEVK